MGYVLTSPEAVRRLIAEVLVLATVPLTTVPSLSVSIAPWAAGGGELLLHPEKPSAAVSRMKEKITRIIHLAGNP